MFFGEEKNINSKGIAYWIDMRYDGNNANSYPTFKDKNVDIMAVNCEKDEYGDEKYLYVGDLVKKDETNWLEFEWNVEGDQM